MLADDLLADLESQFPNLLRRQAGAHLLEPLERLGGEEVGLEHDLRTDTGDNERGLERCWLGQLGDRG